MKLAPNLNGFGYQPSPLNPRVNRGTVGLPTPRPLFTKENQSGKRNQINRKTQVHPRKSTTKDGECEAGRKKGGAWSERNCPRLGEKKWAEAGEGRGKKKRLKNHEKPKELGGTYPAHGATMCWEVSPGDILKPSRGKKKKKK